MLTARHPDEDWHLIYQCGILALLNARLTLVVGGADRPHYDALTDEYADAAFFAPSREATRSPAAHRPPARGDGRPSDR